MNKADKIILLQPRCGKYDMYIRDLPLSLICLATLLYHMDEYSVTIIDQRTDPDWQAHLEKELQDDILMVGITAMTGEPIKHALELAEFVREKSDRPIVWGGIHPTIMPEQTLRNEYVDYVISGKGEFAIVELAEFLKGKRAIEDVSGLVYQGPDERIYRNPPAETFDWEMIPRIPYELVDHTKYYRSGFEGRVVSVLTSRNCPYRCAFCYNSSLKKEERWTAEPVELTKQNLKTLFERFNPDYISFIDDDFFFDQGRAREILEYIREQKWSVKIGFRGARVNELLQLDNAFFDLMVEVNTRHINIGVESGSPEVLKKLRKGITPDMVVELNQRFRHYPSLIPLYNFFSGTPEETLEDIRKSTDLVLQLIRENPYCQISGFHQYTPYPGSTLYEIAKKYGFKEPDTLDGWSTMQLENNAKNCPWINKKRLKLLNIIYTTVYFVDNKYNIYFLKKSVLHRLIYPLVLVYRKFARLRLRHHLTFFPIEVWAKDAFYFLMDYRYRKSPDNEN
jgi:radical SAM superfamily enzyme YgiQ (UPF0313 family)